MGLLALNRFMSMLREQKATRGHGQSHNGSVIASLAIGNNPPCQNDDNCNGGEEVGYAAPDLPQEIWHHLCSKLPMRDAARAACVAHVFLTSWGCHPNLTFTKETMCSKKILCKWTADSNNERYIREYNSTIDHILANHRDGVKTFMLHFYGPDNTESYNRFNRWLCIAITPVLEELNLLLLSEKKKYYFPCSLLSDGSGNKIRHLRITNCVLRPTVNLSLRCLTELFLHTVQVAENELGRLLSNSYALENLILKHCEDIIRLEIPCQLQRLRLLVVFECSRLEAIENKAPNLSSFDFTGREKVRLSLGESLQAKNLRLTSSCVINYVIDKLASSVPNLETMTLWSCREIVDAPIVPSKFLHLKVLNIHMQNWTYDREYDFLSLVSFLDASPSLETFLLSVSVQSKYDRIVGDPSILRQIVVHHHDKLKTVRIAGFCCQKSLVELTRHILESATSLKHLTLTTIDAKYRFYGHTRARKCPDLDKEYARDVWKSIMAVKTYIEGKVPSVVELTVVGPCSQCHAL